MISFVEVNNISDLAKLASEIWHEYWVEILSAKQIDYMVEKFQSERAILSQIAEDNYTYYYIISENNIAGYIGLSQKNDYLFLSKLYLRKEWRHRGLGSKAFIFIKNQAKILGYNNIKLTVNKHNFNTINTYKKWGFKIINSVETNIGNGFIMDDYIMQYII